MSFVDSALTDADLILYVTEVGEEKLPDNKYIEKIKATKIPLVIVVNKIDLSKQDQLDKIVEMWYSAFPDSPIIPVSAINKFNIEPLLSTILELLPEGPEYFPKDQLSDKYERFFASEILREKILLNYKKEVPYSVEVEIETFKESDDLISIRAVIHVARDSQKGIIIGKNGSMLKKVGSEARVDMEAFFGKKIFLELYVKVSKEWRDKPQMLKKFGYQF